MLSSFGPEGNRRYARCGSSDRSRSALRGKPVCCLSYRQTNQNARSRSRYICRDRSSPQRGGEEDEACYDYISGVLLDVPQSPADTQNWVLNSQAACKFADRGHPDFPEADLEHALMIDRFAFAMEVERWDGLLVLKSVS